MYFSDPPHEQILPIHENMAHDLHIIDKNYLYYHQLNTMSYVWGYKIWHYFFIMSKDAYLNHDTGQRVPHI